MNNFKQSNKEAKATLLLYFAYFLWSVCTAYGLGNGNVMEYSYIFGFPAWFFFSCILGYPLCCIGLYFVIKKVFKDTDINTEADNGETHE